MFLYYNYITMTASKKKVAKSVAKDVSKKRTKKSIYMEVIKSLWDLYHDLINEGYISEAKTVLSNLDDLLDEIEYEDDDEEEDEDDEIDC